MMRRSVSENAINYGRSLCRTAQAQQNLTVRLFRRGQQTAIPSAQRGKIAVVSAVWHSGTVNSLASPHIVDRHIRCRIA